MPAGLWGTPAKLQRLLTRARQSVDGLGQGRPGSPKQPNVRPLDADPAASRTAVEVAMAVGEAERLVVEGRIVEAVDLMAATHRLDPKSELAIRLVDLRHLATSSIDPGPGRSPWPPAYDDPFPEVSRQLPETTAASLTTDMLGGAVAHHGALIVRKLFDDAQVMRSVEAIRKAEASRDERLCTDEGAWYRPLPLRGAHGNMLRKIAASQGGIWLADSPASTAHFLEELVAVGVIDVIANHLGERPFFSLQKSTMRRSPPVDRIVAWHQDGSFLDAGVRAVNVWLALSRCGGDYPSPGLEVMPRRIAEILPTEGTLYPHAIAFEAVGEIASRTPTVQPEFDAGDALLFDERFLHRTYVTGSMTKDRYALECWFFAPSHHSTGYMQFLA